jgi:hypothetical protein
MDHSEGLDSSDLIQKYKNLFANIDCLSIFDAPILRGSIYFYTYTRKDNGLSKEELIDDQSVLDAASSCTGIEIKYQDKHHRWIAKLPQSLMILEYATKYINVRNTSFLDNDGVNAELKWFDEQDREVIVHLSRNQDNINWQAARYIN